ncbi:MULTISPECIES: translation initiation factor 2 [Pseudomonas]|uniref:Translation initiation factor 2 n=1 Tax=Pseudomonas sp. Hg7Tf TaxID=3236988 RepID=A0AB39HV25_9PSED|nr:MULTISPECIES: translation initiation factor 2 [Pseudomonas]MDD1975105.1 translation initiation factor 2 [Pseudomonas putida]MDH2559318.1 translation initiation factor 2 [Pseudomonas sp. Hg5Tf]
MRQGPLSLLLCLLLLTPLAQAEEPAVASTPLSLSAGSQITDLQQRLAESERLREALSQQLHNADSERESAQLTRLRQENQRLKLALKELQANTPQRLLSDQQQWFVIGGAVALLAALCGIFASGGHRKRRQWLN